MKSTLNIHWKDWCWSWSSNTFFGHLMWRTDSLEKTLMLGMIEGRKRRGWQRIRCLDGIPDSMDLSLSKLCELVINREAWCAAVHGITKNCTRLSKWTTATIFKYINMFACLLAYFVAQLCPTLCDPLDCNLPGSLFMGFSRQEYWSGLPCPPPGDLPDSGIEPVSHMSMLLLLFSHQVVSDSLRPCELQRARFPCPSLSPWVCSKSCPLSQWCHPNILSSVIPFSSFLQSFPASGSFLVNQHFASGGQSIGASASASVLPITIQGWFPLETTVLSSLLYKGLLRVFFNATVQNLQC